MASLPHAPLGGWECYPSVYFRLCAGCPGTRLSYPVPESVTPEMGSVWSWFDQFTSPDGAPNPRDFCAL